MKFLEKDLEEIIFTTSKEKLSQRGLHMEGKLYRQLRVGKYGIPDLIEVDRHAVIVNNKFSHHRVSITVYELKKDKVGVSTFMQALDYIKGVKRLLELRSISVDVDYSIVLIGRSIDDNSSFAYLPEFLHNSEGCSFLRNITYSYGIDGIKFKEETGYKLMDEGFKL